MSVGYRQRSGYTTGWRYTKIPAVNQSTTTPTSDSIDTYLFDGEGACKDYGLRHALHLD